MLIFITGGVRTGKSSFAEQLALDFGRKKNAPHIHYVATSIPYDEEMKERVRRHKVDREQHKLSFITHEISYDLARVNEIIQDGDVVLIDCLTTLLSNELFAGWENGNEAWKNKRKRESIFRSLLDTFYEFRVVNAIVIIVSNELFQDLIPRDESTFYYLQLLGNLHQELVQLSHQSVLVEYGVPIYKKDV